MRHHTKLFHALALSLAVSAPAYSGSFALTELATVSDDRVVHAPNYAGNSGQFTVKVCLGTVPSPLNTTAVRTTLDRAIATWNSLSPTQANLGTGNGSDLNADQLDFESVILRQLGHALGLGRTNLGADSQLAGPARDATISTRGNNTVYNTLPGSDGIHGSRDDVRSDDASLYWINTTTNNPLSNPSVVDSSTFSIGTQFPAGSLYAANGNRAVLNLLGIPNTEGIMTQGENLDETQRRLTGEDVATLRFARSGVNRIQGNSDDYTTQLVRLVDPNCDVDVEFSTDVALVSTELTLAGVAGDLGVTNALIRVNPQIKWYFNSGNTTTSVTSVTPASITVNEPFTVNVEVNKNTTSITGEPTGNVSVSGPAGNCTIALNPNNGTGSCNITPTTAGSSTLLVKYLGNQGFDHSETTRNITVNPPQVTTVTITSDLPDPSAPGQSYLVRTQVTTVAPNGKTVVISDGHGAQCTQTLNSSGVGECSLSTSALGTSTLTATFAAQGASAAGADTEPHSVMFPAPEVIEHAELTPASASWTPHSSHTTGTFKVRETCPAIPGVIREVQYPFSARRHFIEMSLCSIDLGNSWRVGVQSCDSMGNNCGAEAFVVIQRGDAYPG
jgi:hypothetical protein